MNLLIPDITFKTEAILKKLNFSPEISPAEFIKNTKGKKHRYSSPCIASMGKKILFYSRLYRNEDDKKRFVVEISLAQKMIDKDLFSEYFPIYYEYGIEDGFEWLTRQYFRVAPLENKKQIEKVKKSLSDADIVKVVKAVVNINALSVKKLDFLNKFKIEKYFNYYVKKNYTFKEAIDIKELERFAVANKSLLERENKYFCHGDLSIGNVIFLKNKIKIIDLESVGINNFAYDIAFFTTRLWRNRKYRKKVIETYLKFLPAGKKEIFSILFRVDSAYIAYRALGTNPIEYTARQNEKRNIFFEKILINSLKGFDFIVDNK